jgi:lipoprotein-anchoring transpeptidase ErfK/SrfK
VLREGSRGSDVRALQQRLAALRYYPGTADGNFGASTLEAVWAFQEVNHLPVTGQVASRTKAALVHPHAYQPHYPRQSGTRVEVNLGMGVLVLYRNHRIALVSHESSGGHYRYGDGAYAETPTGKFHAERFISGWHRSELGELYNPVYFVGGYAIHGDTSVPAAPVSHGCVRVPMDIAAWFHRDVRIGSHGTQVWIYNQW